MNVGNTAINKKRVVRKPQTNILLKMFRQRYLYIMLLPALVGIIIFCYIPIAGWIIAFKNYRIGMSVWNAEWVGLSNFKTFFIESSDYIYVIRNTLFMNISTIIINLTLAFAFAILLKEIKMKFFSKTVQTLTFFPFFISWVITYSIFYALLATSSGALNQALIGAGVISEGLNILGNTDFSWILIIAMNAWKYLGYNSVIFIASTAGIPLEQYEAAEIDGAGRFGKIRYITIPNLMPTFIVLLIMNSGWILNSNFEQFYLFTNTTNWETMEVLDMYVYKFGLKLLNYPYATAVGIIKTTVSLLILITVNSISRKITEKSIL